MFKISTKTLRSCISNTAFSFSIERQMLLNCIHDPSRSLSSSTFYNQQPFSPNHHLSKRTISRPVLKSRHNIHRNLSLYNSAQQQQGSSSPSAGSPLNSWKRWIAGVVISAITLPHFKDQINSFLEWKDEVEIIVEDAEIIAEVIEKVAEEVVEIADLLNNQLPEGGKLRNAVDVVENVAKEIVKDAHIAEETLIKVEDFEKEVDSLIAPAIGQVNLNVPKEATDVKGAA